MAPDLPGFIARLSALSLTASESSQAFIMCVQAKAGGGIIFSAKLDGLLTNAEGGFHIHSGNACDPGTSQGGHYWKNEPWPTATTTPWCPISVDPWVPGAPFYSKWESEFDGTAEPVVDLGVGITTNGLFNVGDDPADCGVKGHAVIVHKGGNPTSDDPSEAPGVRVGCCVLA